MPRKKASLKQGKRIYILDTTLRDGEQAPGASISTQGKLDLARQLARMKVDAIEAGFAVSSPVQFEAVKTIATNVKGPRIISLARSVPIDIKAAADATRPAKKRGIHVFIATSDIHMKYKLKKSKEEVLKYAVKSVKMAKDVSPHVEFSCEDATRTQLPFLAKVVAATIDAGADVINIPDTVGYTIPGEYSAMIAYLYKQVPALKKVRLSVHCHNDLGLAVANSLAAAEAGAGQIECTINGIGERAGNASLEEVVMGIITRSDYFKCYTNVNTREIYKASRMVTALTGHKVQVNKAIIGDNAFSHEAGIHQDGVLKHRQTYEIMKAEDVGWPSNRIVMGRHSGRHALQKKVEGLGYTLKAQQLQHLYERFLIIADKKREVYDDDIMALIEEELNVTPKLFVLDYFHIVSGAFDQSGGTTGIIPTATVRIKIGNTVVQHAASGDGPIDAIYRAIDKCTDTPVTLNEFSIQAHTGGKSAMGDVHVVVSDGKRLYNGTSSETDILEAAARAYMTAVNKVAYFRRKASGKKKTTKKSVSRKRR